MASPTPVLFRTVRRIIRSPTVDHNVGNACRFLSDSSALEKDSLEDSSENDDLKSRIGRLRLPKRSATNVLQRWVSEGHQVSASQLRQISEDLSRSQRFKHALEVSEWMVTHEEYELSNDDYAVRIDLMTKVFGIQAAERYFEGLPLKAKTTETYTALLHCFARSKLVDKAEELYAEMKESNLPLGALTFNELMTLYVSVGQVEKVSSVIEELKYHKVAPDIFTYNLWVTSCAANLCIHEVQRILDEMSQDPGSKKEWETYRSLTSIYITSTKLLNSVSSDLVEAEQKISQREWTMYDFLLILYASLGNKDKVDQVWRSLCLTRQKMTSRNYICVLSSYLMLDHIKEVREVIDQWKQSSVTKFDISACKRLLEAYRELGLIDRANTFDMLLMEKCNSMDENE